MPRGDTVLGRQRSKIGIFWQQLIRGDDDGERGSAVIEFTFLGTLLLIPVVYLVLTAGNLQAGSFASVGAADQAAKVFAAAESPQEGRLRAEQAVAFAVTDHGFEASAAELVISCAAGECLAPGSRVTVDVRVAVPLPLIPALVGSSLPAATVSASATEIVARFG